MDDPMDDLISRRRLIKGLNELGQEMHKTNIPMVEHDFRELIDKQPAVDLNEAMRNYTVVGYKFDDLVLFAEACRRENVTEKDLKDFVDNVSAVVRYTMEKLKESVRDMTGGNNELQ